MADEDRFVYQLIVKGKEKEHVFEVLLTEDEAKDHEEGGLVLFKTAVKENPWLRKLKKITNNEP